MKFILIGFLFFSISTSAQRSTFIRIYNDQGTKVSKGFVHAMTDSTLDIELNKSIKTIPLKKIGSIRTKRSGGHNVLVGSAIGLVAGLIIAQITTPPEGTTGSWLRFSKGETIFLSSISGAQLGVLAGGIITLLNKHKVFLINGDSEKFKEFQNYILKTSIDMHSSLKK